eukprot:GHVL01004156.1.p1 GENE.GHVL01004156.1~~GHVL01004156.1.p1  ORF type:complete len:434 (+),score=35.32 GHVL01004156.1:36-1337(+)
MSSHNREGDIEYEEPKRFKKDDASLLQPLPDNCFSGADSDNQVTRMLMLVPPQCLGRIIGTKGSNIASVRRTADCEVKVEDKDNIMMTALHNMGIIERRVFFHGTVKQIVQAVKMIIDLMTQVMNQKLESAPEGTFIMPNDAIKFVLGKAGSNKAKLQETFGCTMHVEQQDQMIQALGGRRVVINASNSTAIVRALYEIISNSRVLCILCSLDQSQVTDYRNDDTYRKNSQYYSNDLSPPPYHNSIGSRGVPLDLSGYPRRMITPSHRRHHYDDFDGCSRSYTAPATSYRDSGRPIMSPVPRLCYDDYDRERVEDDMSARDPQAVMLREPSALMSRDSSAMMSRESSAIIPRESLTMIPRDPADRMVASEIPSWYTPGVSPDGMGPDCPVKMMSDEYIGPVRQFINTYYFKKILFNREITQLCCVFPMSLRLG